VRKKYESRKVNVPQVFGEWKLGEFPRLSRADATFRMPPDFGATEGREAMFKLSIEEGSAPNNLVASVAL